MSSIPGQIAAQQRQDEEAILALILKFFDGLRNCSSEMMLSTVLPNGRATLIRPSPESKSVVIRQSSLAELIERVISIGVGSDEPLEENIALAIWQDGDDGDKYEGRRTEIRVDYDLGMAWTPFEVRKGGKVIHVGTNIFNLLKRVEGERRGEWVISGVADTTRLFGKGADKV